MKFFDIIRHFIQFCDSVLLSVTLCDILESPIKLCLFLMTCSFPLYSSLQIVIPANTKTANNDREYCIQMGRLGLPLVA